jgi:hypothetical protein
MSFSVIWDNDYSLEEVYGVGDGIIHACHCTECGAEITYVLRFDDEKESE